eukprot:gene15575-21673_t
MAEQAEPAPGAEHAAPAVRKEKWPENHSRAKSDVDDDDLGGPGPLPVPPPAPKPTLDEAILYSRMKVLKTQQKEVTVHAAQPIFSHSEGVGVLHSTRYKGGGKSMHKKRISVSKELLVSAADELSPEQAKLEYRKELKLQVASLRRVLQLLVSAADKPNHEKAKLEHQKELKLQAATLRHVLQLLVSAADELNHEQAKLEHRKELKLQAATLRRMGCTIEAEAVEDTLAGILPQELPAIFEREGAGCEVVAKNNWRQMLNKATREPPKVLEGTPTSRLWGFFPNMKNLVLKHQRSVKHIAFKGIPDKSTPRRESFKKRKRASYYQLHQLRRMKLTKRKRASYYRRHLLRRMSTKRMDLFKATWAARTIQRAWRAHKDSRHSIANTELLVLTKDLHQARAMELALQLAAEGGGAPQRAPRPPPSPGPRAPPTQLTQHHPRRPPPTGGGAPAPPPSAPRRPKPAPHPGGERAPAPAQGPPQATTAPPGVRKMTAAMWNVAAAVETGRQRRNSLLDRPKSRGGVLSSDDEPPSGPLSLEDEVAMLKPLQQTKKQKRRRRKRRKETKRSAF